MTTIESLQAENAELRRALKIAGETLRGLVSQLMKPATSTRKAIYTNGHLPGLRNQIRTIVNNASGPIHISVVAEVVHNDGAGTIRMRTPLGTKVGNELHKLTMRGEIQRFKRGFYAKNPPTTSNG